MANRYVDGTLGNDSFDGSIGSPWKTVQKSMNAALAGDVVSVRAGTYTERLTVNVSGATGNYITFQCYGYGTSGAESVIFDYSGLGTVSDGVPYLKMEGRSYVKVQGFTFQGHHTTGTGQQGWRCYGCSYVEMNGCLFSDNRDMSGTISNAYAHHRILGSSHHVTIDSCEYDTIYSSGTEALAFDGGNSHVVSDCYIHDIDQIAVSFRGGAVASYCSGNRLEWVGKKHDNSTWYSNPVPAIVAFGASSITIERNYVGDSNTGISVYTTTGQPDASGCSVRDNILYNDNQSGLQVGDAAGGSRVAGNKFLNNTVVSCLTGIRIAPWATSLSVKNNVFSSCTSLYSLVGAATTGTWDYNVEYNCGSTTGTNTVTGNPQLINPIGYSGSFALNAGSPAIDAGAPGSATGEVGELDWRGAVRINNGRVDIGALEYGSTVIPSGNSDDPQAFDPNTIGGMETGTLFAITAVEILAGGLVIPVIDSATFGLVRSGYAPVVQSIGWSYTNLNGPRYVSGVTITGSDFTPSASLSMQGAAGGEWVIVPYDSNTGTVIVSTNIPFSILSLGPDTTPYSLKITNPDGSWVQVSPGETTGNSTAGTWVNSAVITGHNFMESATASAANPTNPANLVAVEIDSNTGTVITIGSIPYQLLGLVPNANPIIRITNPDGSWADTSGASTTQNPPPPPEDTGTSFIISSSSRATGAEVSLMPAKTMVRIQHPDDDVVNRIQDVMGRTINPILKAFAEVPHALNGQFARQGWSDATLVNGWSAVSTRANPGFVKTVSGDVHLRGQVFSDLKNVGLPVFILPPGYRPSDDLYRPVFVAGGTAVGMVNVAPDGAVRVLHVGGSTVSPVLVSIGGITFPSEG